MRDGARQHVSVLPQEAVEALAIKPDGAYVDATFGGGGHSRLILQRLGERGRLVALDRDPAAIAAGQAMLDARFGLVHASFGRLAEVLAAQGMGKVDGLLFDLGVSSQQLDQAERGFSFRADARLDMRMDTSRGRTAAQWLAGASQEEIEGVLRGYGEERFAHAIAKALVATRARRPIETTRQLATLVAQAVRTREPGQHPATRSFQAIRILVNQELEELETALPQCVDLLRPGGRLVVITFHSLEDRIVKRFISAAVQPDRLPSRLPVRAHELPPPRLKRIGKPVRPSAIEIAANPRARSALMRVAEKEREE